MTLSLVSFRLTAQIKNFKTNCLDYTSRTNRMSNVSISNWWYARFYSRRKISVEFVRFVRRWQFRNVLRGCYLNRGRAGMMRAALGRVGDRPKTPAAPQASNGRGQRPAGQPAPAHSHLPTPHDLRAIQVSTRHKIEPQTPRPRHKLQFCDISWFILDKPVSTYFYIFHLRRLLYLTTQELTWKFYKRQRNITALPRISFVVVKYCIIQLPTYFVQLSSFMISDFRSTDRQLIKINRSIKYYQWPNLESWMT